MKSGILLSAAATTLFLVGAAATAQPGHGRGPNADTDGDGRVSRAEAMAVAERMFTRLDLDADGAITKVEAVATHGGRNRPGVAMLDQDGSGGVTLDEFTAPALARFDAADSNQDGTISDQERAEAIERRTSGRDRNMSRDDMTARLSERFAMLDADQDGTLTAEEIEMAQSEGKERARPKRGDRGGKRGRRGSRGRTDPMTALFEAADTDLNGVVTRAEHEASAAERFAAADTDADGYVTKSERRAAFQAARPQ